MFAAYLRAEGSSLGQEWLWVVTALTLFGHWMGYTWGSSFLTAQTVAYFITPR
jgi:hypothetical protein